MQVWKFGGTSVGKPERMQSIHWLVANDSNRKIIVLSALSGTTNALISIGKAADLNEVSAVDEQIDALEKHYHSFVNELYHTEEGRLRGLQIVEAEFAHIRSLTGIRPFTSRHDKELVAEGEILSTQLFASFLEEQNENSVLISALDFMQVDADGEPETTLIKEKVSVVLDQYADKKTIITQGFICRNPRNEIDNLKRGGSDYTASLIGAAIGAQEIQIWTDIDGMHNNDPRIVQRTVPVRELSFEEAAELAYFGAKILHPSTITPAKIGNVPVRLKNTLQPDAPGTLISNHTSSGQDVKAIAAKDNITAIYIHSTRMLNAYGFLRRVFSIFENYKTPVDMITTSEVSVSVTIDNPTHLEAISAELREFADLEENDKDQTIICIVGDFSADKAGIAWKVLDAVKDIPIRMISYGASEHNLSLLLHTSFKEKALNNLNEALFFKNSIDN